MSIALAQLRVPGLLGVASVALGCQAPPRDPIAPNADSLQATPAPSKQKTEERAWIATWVSAQQATEPGNMPPAPLAGNTLRQVVQTTLGGERIRVTFSNHFGNAPLTITSAAAGLSAGGDAVAKDSAHALSLAGNATSGRSQSSGARCFPTRARSTSTSKAKRTARLSTRGSATAESSTLSSTSTPSLAIPRPQLD
jgi:hypothetical protein